MTKIIFILTYFLFVSFPLLAQSSQSHSGKSFGPEELLTHQFPKDEFHFKRNPNPDDIDSTGHQKALYNIWKFYLELIPLIGDNEPCLHELPEIDSVRILSLGDDQWFFRNFIDLRDTVVVLCYTHKLKNLGKYQVFYIAESDEPESGNSVGCIDPIRKNLERECCRGEFFACHAGGTLLLYDNKFKTANVLRVHFIDRGDGGSMVYRFFYITKKGVVHIYSGYGDMHTEADFANPEIGYRLFETHQIRIVHGKEVRIEETYANE
jgi:hypothetical protein